MGKYDYYDPDLDLPVYDLPIFDYITLGNSYRRKAFIMTVINVFVCIINIVVLLLNIFGIV